MTIIIIIIIVIITIIMSIIIIMRLSATGPISAGWGYFLVV